MSESISLTLKTCDINLSNVMTDYYNKSVVTQYGKIENNKTKYTWYNVNIKNILGELYDKYEKFNITLISAIQSYQADADTLKYNNYLYVIKMSGLNFLSSYNVKTRMNDEYNIINTVDMFRDYQGHIGNFNTTTFYKSKVTNITIKLDSIDTDTTHTYTRSQDLLSHMVFIFNITPVKD